MAAKRPPITYDEFAAEQESEKIPFEAFSETFHIIPPDLMSDEDATVFYDLIGKSADETSGADIVSLARVIIDDYDQFHALGGTAAGLVAYMQRIATDRNEELKAEQGVDEGEGGAS